jgi:acyl-CoA reductase-like NAD-dependent aldehyde dehydrogenase
MQEVLMLVSLSRPRSIQLALFAHPNPKPDWRELSPEAQQKVLRLLALLLRQHAAGWSAVPAAEVRDE